MGEQPKHDEFRTPGEPISQQPIPFAEWAVAGVGLTIVLTVLGFLLTEAVHGSESPPRIRIDVVGVEAQEGAYLVRLKLFNEGGSTAAQLVLEGTVTPENGEIQRSQITLDYLPAHSERGAGLFFTSDPNKARLEVRALGFEDP